MSYSSLKNVTDKLYKSYTFNMFIKDLAFNEQGLICHNTDKPNNQPIFICI